MVKSRAQKRKSALRARQDFVKQKDKIGRKKHEKSNVTKTDFTSREIVVPEQAAFSSERSNADIFAHGDLLHKKKSSYVDASSEGSRRNRPRKGRVSGTSGRTVRRLSIPELLVRTRHYSSRIRKDAFLGLRELVSASAHSKDQRASVCGQLAPIVRSCAAALIDLDDHVRHFATLLVRSLVETVPVELRAFFPLLAMALNNAFSHISQAIRMSAVSTLETLISAFSSADRFRFLAPALLPTVESALPFLITNAGQFSVVDRFSFFSTLCDGLTTLAPEGRLRERGPQGDVIDVDSLWQSLSETDRLSRAAHAVWMCKDEKDNGRQRLPAGLCSQVVSDVPMRTTTSETASTLPCASAFAVLTETWFESSVDAQGGGRPTVGTGTSAQDKRANEQIALITLALRLIPLCVDDPDSISSFLLFARSVAVGYPFGGKLGARSVRVTLWASRLLLWGARLGSPELFEPVIDSIGEVVGSTESLLVCRELLKCEDGDIPDELRRTIVSAIVSAITVRSPKSFLEVAEDLMSAEERVQDRLLVIVPDILHSSLSIPSSSTSSRKSFKNASMAACSLNLLHRLACFGRTVPLKSYEPIFPVAFLELSNDDQARVLDIIEMRYESFSDEFVGALADSVLKGTRSPALPVLYRMLRLISERANSAKALSFVLSICVGAPGVVFRSSEAIQSFSVRLAMVETVLTACAFGIRNFAEVQELGFAGVVALGKALGDLLNQGFPRRVLATAILKDDLLERFCVLSICGTALSVLSVLGKGDVSVFIGGLGSCEIRARTVGSFLVQLVNWEHGEGSTDADCHRMRDVVTPLLQHGGHEMIRCLFRWFIDECCSSSQPSIVGNVLADKIGPLLSQIETYGSFLEENQEIVSLCISKCRQVGEPSAAERFAASCSILAQSGTF